MWNFLPIVFDPFPKATNKKPFHVIFEGYKVSLPLNQTLSLKITLNKTNPAIWRRVLVPASVKFFDLHHIIQISMDWKNSHLFEFQVGDYKIGYIDPNEAFEDTADAGEVTLDLLLTKEGFTFTYLYDFGDNWQHSVEVERILENENDKVYPVCTKGQLASHKKAPSATNKKPRHWRDFLQRSRE